jgi:hypothetical protein
MANERLEPFRDYDEHDVINLFSFDDAAVTLNNSTVVYAGSVVKIRTGWSNTDEVQFLGGAGANYDNVVSQRYGVNAKVEYCNGGPSEVPLGITLYDVREYDENGELLKFNPQKAAELQATVSGQAVPVATKGIFLMATGAFTDADALAAGSSLYATGNGQLSPTVGGVKVGKALGDSDADGSVLVKLEL